MKSTISSQHLITRDAHHISKLDISDNAVKVLNRLNSSKYESYLVGGSVRDLLLKKCPKDFDVATNATPTEIKKLFRNARIIGRRFKLVHVLFGRDVIEVATFRGQEPTETDLKANERGMLIRDNVYGSLEEDAWRRDFTINSLYYHIQDASIIDFTGGFKDINQKLIRMIGDPATRYQEDPVRMIRAVRFAAKLNFTIEPNTLNPIPKMASLLSHVSSSRLFDETVKLFHCGESQQVIKLLKELKLFSILFNELHLVDNQYQQKMDAFISLALESTDNRVKSDKPVNPAFLFAVILWFPMKEKMESLIQEKMDRLPALEKAMSFVLGQQCRITAIPKRYTQVIREIWLLQFRLPKRHGQKAHQLLSHPRFRAAYDFLGLRALSNDESLDLANWWTTFQDADESMQQNMIDNLEPPTFKKKPKRRRKKTAAINKNDITPDNS